MSEKVRDGPEDMELPEEELFETVRIVLKNGGPKIMDDDAKVERKDRSVQRSNLFHPDTLTEHTWENLNVQKALTPELEMYAEMLKVAVNDCLKHLFAQDSKTYANYRDAERWIFDDSTDSITDFCIICDNLKLEPSYVRRCYLCLKERFSFASAKKVNRRRDS